MRTANEALSEYEALLPEENTAPPADWPALQVPTALPPFPVECLPSPVREMVEAVAASSQISVDMAACFALGAASTALVGNTEVRAKAGHSEPVQLYIAVSAAPSERKSGAMSLLFAPLRAWEKRQNDALRPQIIYSQSQKKQLEKQLAGAKDAQRRQELADELARFEEVRPVWLCYSDATPEGLVKVMGQNVSPAGGGSGAIVSAEGAVLGVLAGTYSENVNLDVFLQGYSGEAVSVTRVTREDVHLDRADLSVTLAVQPVVLEAFLGNDKLRSRGLCARFLYAAPESRLGQRVYLAAPDIPGNVRMAYHQRMTALADMHGTWGTLTLTPEALQAFDEWFAEVEGRMLGDLSGLAGGWEGKLCGNTLRIAGLLKMMENPCREEPITAAQLRKAVSISRYFIEQVKAMAGASGGLSEDAQAVLKAALKVAANGTFSMTALWDKLRHRAQFEGKRSEVEAALLELEEAGYLRRANAAGQSPTAGVRPCVSEIIPASGRPKGQRYELNPCLLSKAETKAATVEVVEL